MKPQLANATLDQLAPAVGQARYNRESTGVGIVHLGIGAFHRAHQAVYTQEAMNRSGGDWCIAGVSLRSADVAQQLQPQDCLYSVLSEDDKGQSLTVVAAVKEVLVAPRQLEAVIAAIANPATKIITLTVTEKGYCTAPDGVSLDRQSAAVQADLASPALPKTAIGLLALGLSRRQAQNAGPVTVISCDNLAENGRVLAAVLRDYVASTFPGIVSWLDSSVSFPCSMVDRIVPAMNHAQQARQVQMLGLADNSAIATEPFSQWIIEERFCTPRPDWESVGVQFVDDIRPYESIKLGLLNASHSAIAYCGLLAGRQTVDEVMSDAVLSRFIGRLMSQALVPALAVPADFDLDAYQAQLLARFANPRLAHRCEQIAMDGSEKISQRWLPALQHTAHRELLVKALGSWCYLVLHTDIPLDDPRQDSLLALRRQRDDAPLAQLLAIARIDTSSVPDFNSLKNQVNTCMDTIKQQGVNAMLAQ